MKTAKAYNVRAMPPELHHGLKVQAAKSGITMESLIIAILEDGLKRLEK